MASKLPVPRVEIRKRAYCSWNVLILRTATDPSRTMNRYRSKWAVVVAARRWSLATGWPLVIDGKVVE